MLSKLINGRIFLEVTVPAEQFAFFVMKKLLIIIYKIDLMLNLLQIGFINTNRPMCKIIII